MADKPKDKKTKDEGKPKDNGKLTKKNIKEVLADNDLSIVKTEDLKRQALSTSKATEVFDPVNWAQFKEMAKTFIDSGALPEGTNAEKLIIKMQAGFEMGMKPFEAIKGLYIVNGMIAIGGRDLIKQLRKHGWVVSYTDESNESVTATVSKGDENYTDTFTFEQAKKSGWTTAKGSLKPGWKEGANRDLKMRYAVVSKIVKSYLPEVMGTAVDIMEVAEDTIPVISGEAIEQEISDEDLKKIQDAKTFTELTKVTQTLKKKYKVKQLKYAYDAKREELEEKQ